MPKKLLSPTNTDVYYATYYKKQKQLKKLIADFGMEHIKIQSKFKIFLEQINANQKLSTSQRSFLADELAEGIKSICLSL